MTTTRKTKLPVFYPKSRQHVTVVLNQNKPSELVFQGMVRQIQSDGRIEIELPDTVNPDHITVGLETILQYNCDDAYCHFMSRIIEVSEVKSLQRKSGILYRIVIAPQGDATKIQRRDHFRISEHILVRLRQVLLPNHFIEDQEIRRRSVLEFKKQSANNDVQVGCSDLGGGGLGGHSDSALMLNHHYLATFSLDNKEFSVVMIVRHSEKTNFGKYRVGLEYVGLTDRDREHIIRHVFKIQSRILLRSKSD